MGQKRLFNDGWTFYRSNLKMDYNTVQTHLEEFVPVMIPHDWLIYQEENLYEDGCGWYRKMYTYEKKGGPDKTQSVFLRFDGVYMDSTLYVNGKRAGAWKYGYSAFTVDIGSYLTDGENELLLQVRFRSPNSRWYSGAGIYRNVWIKECGDTFLILDGTYVYTEEIAGRSTDFNVRITTEFRSTEDNESKNSDGGQAKASQTDESINDASGLNKIAGMDRNVPSDKNQTGKKKRETKITCRYTFYKDESPLQTPCMEANVAAEYMEKNDFSATYRGMVRGVRRWSPDTPNCYILQVELVDEDGKVIDQDNYTIGFRKFTFDRDRGLFINGIPTKINGVCEHHDLGCLGSAYHHEAMKRKLLTLKEMGVNAIRTSHNMPDPDVMELADRFGFLVVNEAFDMWERSKTKYDYARFFKDWVAKDVKSWVCRDRNHPSLLMWSIGNEIYDTHVDEHGLEIARKLQDLVLKWDPNANAPVTIGSNYMPWENAQKCANLVKFAGYNYGEECYDEHHKEHPNWIIYGSETGSIVQSRNIYHFPLEASILSEEDEQCSALGNSITSWGARSFEKLIVDHRDRKYCLGQFIWSGHDYIGEPTPYHTRNSYFGQIDTAGFPKDSYYLFRAEWGKERFAPFVHVFPYWDFNPGQMIDVRATTNATYLELFVNGESMGRQEINHNRGQKLFGDWKVPYQPGNITVVAYDSEGKEIAYEKKESFSESASIDAACNKTILRAGGDDLAYITIRTRDAEGHLVENACDYIQVTTEGPIQLMGMDNGDSTDDDPYKTNVRRLFGGKLLAVIGSTNKTGEGKVTITGRDLKEASISLQCVSGEVKEDAWFVPEPIKYREIPENVIPLRKISLRFFTQDEPDDAEQGKLTPEKSHCTVAAKIYPANATLKELKWQVVNKDGIEVNYAKITPLYDETSEEGSRMAEVMAIGDGDFYVRCLGYEKAGGRPKIISILECNASDFGEVYFNPYKPVCAGLYSGTIGEITKGNEKGIATQREGRSGVIFKGVNLRSFGSDEMRMSFFNTIDKNAPVEIWLGDDQEELLGTVEAKPALEWNTYQEEHFKLPRRLNGVVTLSFIMHDKMHFKEFCFEKQEKAYVTNYPADAQSIYGDSYMVDDHAVRKIGNNVVLVFEDMNFGLKGCKKLLIKGFTPLEFNTIQLRFTNDVGRLTKQVLEYSGDARGYMEFDIEPLYGLGKVEFVFLPGSYFDFEEFRFE